ncbi:archaetidylserine decarboxylase [Methylobacter sp.]|uniref:archaetidylserine decarboxylase n=1 Tax=Methylobacter sp. TaxID=2051955 RepID=UPI0024891325|nr:archaetidylserine decarboxylase [Methylobacter sp.]MDI1279075.1 archaetidylserine decarboxylase [Methylobacter sp.]MDI1359902.1 archaetidylserine decarboxylase [Methylobacter sp.]
MNFKEALTTLPQYVLPHHALSTMMSKLTHCENKTWKNLFIKQIIKHYGVNMDEAREPNINAYKSFNDFFTRELKPGVRPLSSERNVIVCPADGAVSQAGDITEGQIFQAKGKSFTATDLLGGNEARAEPFNNGIFTTIYLSPKDYHRLHMPLTGTLKEMVHIPGRLFSVNPATVNSVPELFARNERVAAIFDTEVGPMALVLVGAIFVSSVETVWHGVVTPPSITTVQNWQYGDDAPTLKIGEEMGRFNMGSTIIVLFGKDKAQWDAEFKAEKTVKLGELIGRVVG